MNKKGNIDDKDPLSKLLIDDKNDFDDGESPPSSHRNHTREDIEESVSPRKALI